MLAPLLAALLAATPAHATAPGRPGGGAHSAVDPCDGIRSLPADPACGDGPLCPARVRVKLACDLRDALESRYVFFPVKGRMGSHAGGGFDSRRHLDACVAGERAIPREDDPLRFYDRMRLCLAAFDDGHLRLGAPTALPQVALGLGLRLAGGHVYVANRERKLVSWLRTVSGVDDLERTLAPGNEVVELDGRPVLDAVRDLARYEPGSSEAARLERAVDALTRRDFAFPGKRTTTVALLADGARRVVELPWWISPEGRTNVMTRAYVHRTGIATTDLLSWRYDAGKNTWDRDADASQGLLRTDPILPARDAAFLREYDDEQGQPAVRLGEVVRRRDRAFCYLQILSFLTETLSGRDGREPFPAVVDGFVRECRDKDLDLVLDLRQNQGGYLSHSSALVAALSPPGATYAGGALLLRASTQNLLVYQERSPALGAVPARALDDALEPRRIADAIGAARRAREEFTPAFLEAPLHPSATVGGYSGRVVVLTSPSCASACDRAVAMLRSDGRAVLVGGPTEGAGGSQQETRNLGARWSDAAGLLWVSIPNAAMGVQPAGAPSGSERSAARFFEALALENRPVQPDVPYETTLADLEGSNRGWLAQVDRVLFEEPGATPHQAPPAAVATAASPAQGAPPQLTRAAR